MKHLGLVFAVLLATSGCASLSSQAPSAYATATTAELKGDAARPSAGHGWVRSELYFGVGEEQGAGNRPQADTISDAQWRAFLDKEVTPRFPDGLTVFDAYGCSAAMPRPTACAPRCWWCCTRTPRSAAPTSRRSAWRGSSRPGISRCCGRGSRSRYRSELKVPPRCCREQ